MASTASLKQEWAGPNLIQRGVALFVGTLRAKSIIHRSGGSVVVKEARLGLAEARAGAKYLGIGGGAWRRVSLAASFALHRDIIIFDHLQVQKAHSNPFQ